MGILDSVFGGSQKSDDKPDGKPKSKSERVEMYRQFLAAEGYAPQVEAEGVLVFKSEGKVYLIMPDDKDEVYFRLLMPNFWSIENEPERRKVLKAAAFANAQTKVAKIFPLGDNTCASIELFCSPPDAFKPVFKRALSAIRTAVDNFVSKMRE